MALLAVSSVVLVSTGVVAGISAAGADRGAPIATHTPATVRAEAPVATANELTANAADAFNRASVALAAELATPQTIANAFAFTQGIARLKP